MNNSFRLTGQLPHNIYQDTVKCAKGGCAFLWKLGIHSALMFGPITRPHSAIRLCLCLALTQSIFKLTYRNL